MFFIIIWDFSEQVEEVNVNYIMRFLIGPTVCRSLLMQENLVAIDSPVNQSWRSWQPTVIAIHI